MDPTFPSVAVFAPPPHASEALVPDIDHRMLDACVAWLLNIAVSRDLGLRAPEGAEAHRWTAEIVAALGDAFASFAASFVGYRALIADARSAARKNDEELGRIIARGAEDRKTIAHAADIARAMLRSGTDVARCGDALSEVVAALRDGVVGAHGDIERVAAVVRELEANARGGSLLLENLAAGWKSVSTHADTITRSSRQARLLAINAAIEAAYVSESGSGFAIVASQMRTLSHGALEGARAVRRILDGTADSFSIAARETLAMSMASERMLRDLTKAADGLALQTDARDALAATVSEISATAEKQLATVALLAEGAERLRSSASAILVDAGEAAGLQIAARLDEAESLVARYPEVTIGAPPRPHLPDDPLARFVGAIALGIEDASQPPEFEPHLRELATAAVALLRMLLDDEREIVRRLIELSVAFARNGSRWQSILRSASGVGEEARSYVTSLEKANAAVAAQASGFADVRSRLTEVGNAASGAIEVISEAVAEVVATRAHGDAFHHAIEEIGVATESASAEFSVVTDLSGDATLLSINAAIEAAHAGERGAGFSVIANEIGILAMATRATAESIVRDMVTLREQSEQVRERGAERLAQIEELATATASQIAALGAIVRDSRHTAGDVSDAATGQVGNVEVLLRAFSDLADAFPRMHAAMTPERRAEFAAIGTRAHALASRRKLGFVVEGVVAAAIMAAAEIEEVFAATVGRGLVPAAAFSALSYERIGSEEPAIYRTGYDEAVRPATRAVLDRLTEHPAVFSCGVFDLNAYAAVIASKSAAGRERRIWDDLARRPLRVGIESVRPLSDRTTREELERAGVSLASVKPRPVAVCTYVIDTGAVFNEIGCAIDLLGTRVATLSVLFNAERV